MRSMLLFLAVGLLVGVSDGKQDEKAADELRGIWLGKSQETSDWKLELSSIWEFNEGKLVLSSLKPKSRAYEWKYRLDPKKNPKEIDLMPASGQAAGRTSKGIYKIEKDTLTICHIFAVDEESEKKDRPTEFDANNRKDVSILTFERKKP